MQIQEFLDCLFAAAEKAGLKDYEAYATESESFRVSVQNAAVEDYRVNSSRAVSFRVIDNGKAGYAFTRALDEDAVAMLIREASQNAKVVDSDEPQFLYDGSGEYAKLAFDASRVEAMTAAEKIELAKTLEAAALSHPEVARVHSAMVSTSGAQVYLQNSRGLKLHFNDRMLVAMVMPIVPNGEGFLSGHEFALTRDPATVNVQEVADSAVKEALSMVGAAPLDSGNYPVIFKRGAMSDLLSTFSGIFSAENAQKGLSQLNGREGETVAAPCVTILDDPLQADGVNSRPFDDEGVPTKTKAIVEKGVLTTLLHNLKTAAKAGVASTGNAYKASTASPVTVAPINFFIQPGDKSREELEAAMGNGLVITDVSGLHAGANATSGDFSLICEGYEVVDGKAGRPMEQMTVSGNFYTLLQNIVAVANDLRSDGSSVSAPSVWVKEMALAGK